MPPTCLFSWHGRTATVSIRFFSIHSAVNAIFKLTLIYSFLFFFFSFESLNTSFIVFILVTLILCFVFLSITKHFDHVSNIAGFATSLYWSKFVSIHSINFFCKLILSTLCNVNTSKLGYAAVDSTEMNIYTITKHIFGGPLISE